MLANLKYEASKVVMIVGIYILGYCAYHAHVAGEPWATMSFILGMFYGVSILIRYRN